MVWKNLFSTLVTMGNYFLLIPLRVPLVTEALGKLVHNALAVTLGVAVLAGITASTAGPSFIGLIYCTPARSLPGRTVILWIAFPFRSCLYSALGP